MLLGAPLMKFVARGSERHLVEGDFLRTFSHTVFIFMEALPNILCHFTLQHSDLFEHSRRDRRCLLGAVCLRPQQLKLIQQVIFSFNLR